LTRLRVGQPVAATRRGGSSGTNAGFGQCLDAGVIETDFPACWEETERLRGQALTIHAAMCGETRGTTRLRQRGETCFTSAASAAGESTGPTSSGEQANTWQRTRLGRFGGWARSVRVSARTLWQMRSGGFGCERGRCGGACWHAELVESNASALGTVAMRQNCKRVTAAVMLYGYWRGEFFGGCEPRCGKGGPLTIGRRLRSALVGASSGNAANPIRFRGAINSRP